MSLPPLLHRWGASLCTFHLVVLCSAIPAGMEMLCCASRCHYKLSVLWHCTQPPVPALELQGWTKLEERKGLLLERFSSAPLSPPHLYSSPQGGGGSSGYWSWERFICKCPCVQVQAPDPRRGASIHPCHPAGSGRRAWSASWCCGWDGGQEALPDPWGQRMLLWDGPCPSGCCPGGFGVSDCSTRSPAPVSQGRGCRSPAVTRALGSAQETHLITHSLPGSFSRRHGPSFAFRGACCFLGSQLKSGVFSAFSRAG